VTGDISLTDELKRDIGVTFDSCSWLNSVRISKSKIVLWCCFVVCEYDKLIQKITNICGGKGADFVGVIWEMMCDWVNILTEIEKRKIETDQELYNIDNGKFYFSVYPWIGNSLGSHKFLDVLAVLKKTILKINENPFTVLSQKRIILGDMNRYSEINAVEKLFLRSLIEFSGLRGFDKIITQLKSETTQSHVIDHLDMILEEGMIILIRCMKVRGRPTLPFSPVMTVREFSRNKSLFQKISKTHKFFRLLIYVYLMDKISRATSDVDFFWGVYENNMTDHIDTNKVRYFEKKVTDVWDKNHRFFLKSMCEIVTELTKLKRKTYYSITDNTATNFESRDKKFLRVKRLKKEEEFVRMDVLRCKINNIKNFKFSNSGPDVVAAIGKVMEGCETIRAHISSTMNIFSKNIDLSKLLTEILYKFGKDGAILKKMFCEVEKVTYMNDKMATIFKTEAIVPPIPIDYVTCLILVIYVERITVLNKVIIIPKPPPDGDMVNNWDIYSKKRAKIYVNCFIDGYQPHTYDSFNLLDLNITKCCGNVVTCVGHNIHGLENVCSNLTLEEILNEYETGKNPHNIENMICFDKRERSKVDNSWLSEVYTTDGCKDEVTVSKYLAKFKKMVHCCGVFYDDKLCGVDLKNFIVITCDQKKKTKKKRDLYKYFGLCKNCGCVFKRDLYNVKVCADMCNNCWALDIGNASIFHCDVGKSKKYISPSIVRKIIKKVKGPYKDPLNVKYIRSNMTFSDVAVDQNSAQQNEVEFIDYNGFELMVKIFMVDKYELDCDSKAVVDATLIKKTKRDDWKNKYKNDEAHVIITTIEKNTK